MNKRKSGWLFWVLALVAILAAVCILSFSTGPVSIPLNKIIETVGKEKGTTEYTILFGIRLPRIILGMAVGGALALSGVILQGMFRNPLVEPYTLGISGGAALGVCLNIILRINKIGGILSLPLSGFLGATAVVLLVYFLSIREKIFRIQGLLLTGVMISFIASSLIMLIMAISRTEELRGIIFWIMGSLDESNWLLIKTMLFISFAGLLASYLFCSQLNALSLGEEEAAHLGINVERIKRLLFLLASILTGCSVSVSGIIGFVGLAIPHFIRLFVGSDFRILFISSFLAGSSFLILCDTLARTIIAPLELPVGVITGIIGGSIFIYLLNTRYQLLGRKK